MKPSINITHPKISHRQLHKHPPRDIHAADHKAKLVDLGAFALARGEWAMVQAITHIIAARGLRHE